MAWNQQGGGPWGGGSGGPEKGPWGGSKGPRRSGGSGNNNSTPPDLDEMFKQAGDRLRNMFGGSGSGTRPILILVLLVLGAWLLSGIFWVREDEQGVVLRFGKHVATTGAGVHYHLPYPIETVEKPKVTFENLVEVGVVTRGVDISGNPVRQPVPTESFMLTGDENIINLSFSVMWTIKDSNQFLFNIREPKDTVKWAAESAMREVVGQKKIQEVLSSERMAIQEDTHRILQSLLDEYGAGIEVQRVQLLSTDPPDEVIDAFNDVQRAEAYSERVKREGDSYAAARIPAAETSAVQMTQKAEAHRIVVVRDAEALTSMFLAVAKEHALSPAATERRIYLDTMGSIYADTNKILIDGGASGVLPYLPLSELKPRSMRDPSGQLTNHSLSPITAQPLTMNGALPITPATPTGSGSTQGPSASTPASTSALGTVRPQAPATPAATRAPVGPSPDPRLSANRYPPVQQGASR